MLRVEMGYQHLFNDLEDKVLLTRFTLTSSIISGRDVRR
jgi:hypothetical protein